MGFISSYILRETPLNTQNGEVEESEEDFQRRVEGAVQYMKTWNWGDNEENDLAIAEGVVRDCRSIKRLSDCNPPPRPAQEQDLGGDKGRSDDDSFTKTFPTE